MQNTTPLLLGFHLPTLRRKPRSASQKLADEIRKVKQKSFIIRWKKLNLHFFLNEQ